MTDKTNLVENGTDRTNRIVRDLRAYADDGMEPIFALKLLAIAAELETLAGTRESKTA